MSLRTLADILHRVYAGIRLISLDVLAGAIGGGIMVDRFLATDLGWEFYCVLGLAVWLIYTLDHLLDAQRLRDRASTPRHLFHYKHFQLLGAIWIALAALTGFLAVWWLEMEAILFGIGVGALTILHLLIVRLVGNKTSPFLIKEFGVALIYAVGIWGFPMLKTSFPEPWVAAVLFVQFLLLALVNLLEFSWFEWATDERDGQTSFVRALGRDRSRRIILLLLVAFGILGMVSATLLDYGIFWQWKALRVLLIHSLMATVLASLLIFPKYFEQNERYRSWGDGAFLLTFLSLWILP